MASHSSYFPAQHSQQQQQPSSPLRPRLSTANPRVAPVLTLPKKHHTHDATTAATTTPVAPSRLKQLIDQAKHDTEQVLDKDFVHQRHHPNQFIYNTTRHHSATGHDFEAHPAATSSFLSPTRAHGTAPAPRILERHSYTAHRLLNSTPAQMDQDSRVITIGPIPREWVAPEEHNWHRRYLVVRRTLAKTRPWRNIEPPHRHLMRRFSSGAAAAAAAVRNSTIDAINDRLFLDVSDEMAGLVESDDELDIVISNTSLSQRSDAANAPEPLLEEPRKAAQNNEDRAQTAFRRIHWDDDGASQTSASQQQRRRSSVAPPISDRERIFMRRRSEFTVLKSDEGLDRVEPVYAPGHELNNIQEENSASRDNSPLLRDVLWDDSPLASPSQDPQEPAHAQPSLSDMGPLDEYSSDSGDDDSVDPLDEQLKTHSQPKPVFIGVPQGQASRTLRDIVHDSTGSVGTGTSTPNDATAYLNSIRDRYDLKPPRPSTIARIENGYLATPGAQYTQNSARSASEISGISAHSSVAPSFVTAQELFLDDPLQPSTSRHRSSSHRLTSTVSFESFATADGGDSCNSLHGNTNEQSAESHSNIQQRLPTSEAEAVPAAADGSPTHTRHIINDLSHMRYHFDDLEDEARFHRERVNASSDLSVNMRKYLSKKKIGEAIRFENILVLIKSTTEKSLPTNFNEVESCDTHVDERWKEYVVVARCTGDTEEPIVVQFYETRTIKHIDETLKPASKYDFRISTHMCAKFYSTLDKTVVTWVPIPKGTRIYIFRARTHNLAIRLLAFFSKVIGTTQSRRVIVAIPDLAIKLDIKIPWKSILKYNADYSNHFWNHEKLTYDDLKSTLARASPVIVFLFAAITKKLVSLPGIRDSFVSMIAAQKVGLAWRRYDRLEWVREITDSSIQAGWVLTATHDLELRPKAPYPTIVTFEDGTRMDEPVPIEGFLLRLTRWNGKSMRGNKVHSHHHEHQDRLHQDASKFDEQVHKLFYKKLYFHTHDNLLFFSKPLRAVPPAPPGLDSLLKSDDHGLFCEDVQHDDGTDRTASAAVPIGGAQPATPPEAPMIYETRPYENDEEEEISWLNGSDADPEVAAARDKAALYEVNRRVSMIVGADGFIDMCEIDYVRRVRRGEYPQTTFFSVLTFLDDNVDDANLGRTNSPAIQAVFFDNEHNDEDGEVDGFLDDTVFEIVMLNGIVIRLQAFNQLTRDTWIKSLSELSRYWKRRVYEDVALLNMVRQTNLQQLHIDEDFEPFVGEANAKWETSGGIAHPSIFHVSRISWARSIALRGMLYQKPNKHTTFRHYYVVLTHGYVMLYSVYNRSVRGNAKHRADHRRFQAISLENCYVYSGTATQQELMLRDRWFDMNHPGSHSIPRVYPDGWKSSEEESSRCFVLWFPTKRLIVDKDKNTKKRRAAAAAAAASDDASSGAFSTGPGVKMANRLGVTGISMVFMARSRQERDIWVTSLNTEVERLIQSSTHDIYVDTS